jgi:hypothetical protein
MPTFWDPAIRDDYCRRVGQLTPNATARWGKFTAAGMMAHLNNAVRLAVGELPCEPKNVPLRFFPLKQLVLYVLPFPKGAPTAHELLVGCTAADLKTEQETFVQLAQRAATKSPADAWPDHPAFGAMSHKAWGKLLAKHVEHHLKQFSV